MKVIVRWHTSRPEEKRPSQEQMQLANTTLEQVLPNASSDSVPLYQQLVELSMLATTSSLVREWAKHILARFDSFCLQALSKSHFELWDEPFRIRNEYNAIYKNTKEAKTLSILLIVARILTYGELLRQVNFAAIDTSLLRQPPKDLVTIKQSLREPTPHDFFGNELITTRRNDIYPTDRWGIYTDLSRPLQPQLMACCYQSADDSPGCWISLVGNEQPFGVPLQYTLVTMDYWQQLAENKLSPTALANEFEKNVQIGTAFLKMEVFEKLHKTIQANLKDFSAMLQKAYIAYMAELDAAVIDQTPLPMSPSIGLSSMDLERAKSMMMLLFRYNEPHNVTYPAGNELSWIDTHFFKIASVSRHWTMANRGGLLSDDGTVMFPFLPQVDWTNIDVTMYETVRDLLDRNVAFQKIATVRARLTGTLNSMVVSLESVVADQGNLDNATKLAVTYNDQPALDHVFSFQQFQIAFNQQVTIVNGLISKARIQGLTAIDGDALAELQYTNNNTDFETLLRQAEKKNAITTARNISFNGGILDSLDKLVKTDSVNIEAAYNDQVSLFDIALPIYNQALAIKSVENNAVLLRNELIAFKNAAASVEGSITDQLKSIRTNIVRINMVAPYLSTNDPIPPNFFEDTNASVDYQETLNLAIIAWNKAVDDEEVERKRLEEEENERKRLKDEEIERKRLEDEERKRIEDDMIRDIAIPIDVRKSVQYTITPPPRSGPAFYKEKIEWLKNSCWMDSVFTALFAYPGNKYAQSILNATKMFGKKKCSEEQFIEIHKAICKDIKQLSTPLSGFPRCSLDARRLWNNCVKNTVADNGTQSATNVIETLQSLYGEEELLLIETTPTAFIDDQKAPGDVNFVVVAFEGDDQTETFERVSRALDEFTLTAVILQGSNHFIVNLLDLYEPTDWYNINYTTAIDGENKRIVQINKLTPAGAITDFVIRSKESIVELEDVPVILPPANDQTFKPTHFIYMRTDEVKHLQGLGSKESIVEKVIRLTQGIINDNTAVNELESFIQDNDAASADILQLMKFAGVLVDNEKEDVITRMTEYLNAITTREVDSVTKFQEYIDASVEYIPDQVLELFKAAEILQYNDNDYIDALMGHFENGNIPSAQEELDASAAVILSNVRGDILTVLDEAGVLDVF